MEFEINHVPLEMKEIPDKLFNSPFLSDVSFVFEEKQIYAHSLELMKRSIVFQKQLEPTLGEKKLIPITDYGYDVFYQFIRFIYTDQCYIDKLNWYELLKLAKTFKVIRLVNIVQNSKYPNSLKMYDFSIVENHQITLNHAKERLTLELNSYINGNEFKSIHSDALEGILKFDSIDINMSELNILEALIRWMTHYCEQNQIQSTQCRQKFDNLIRLIRFPTMTIEQLQHIRTEYPDLLTKSDFQNIGGHIIYGPDYEDQLWNCTPRLKLSDITYDWKNFSAYAQFLTKFCVSTEMILGGFILGTMRNFERIHVTISCNNPEINGTTQTTININLNEFHRTPVAIIYLGSSILIRPNSTYIINYDFISNNDKVEKEDYYCRKPEFDVILNAPPNTIKILEAHETMHELLFFKPVSL